MYTNKIIQAVRSSIKSTQTLRWSSNFDPHDRQKEILELYHRMVQDDKSLTSKIIVVSAGRRSGKTALAREVLGRSIEYLPGKLLWWAAPTFERSAKEFDLFSLIFRGLAKIEKKFYRITLPNQTILEFKSLDRWENLRGDATGLIIIDEAARISKKCMEDLIYPMLLDHDSLLLLISTPRGKNWFYDWFKRDEYYSFQFSAYSNPYIPKERIDELKDVLPEDVFRQEILAEFLEDSAGVFRGLSLIQVDTPLKGLSSCFSEEAKNKTYYIGLDLGRVNDYTFICVYALDPKLPDKLELVFVHKFTAVEWSIQKARFLDILKYFTDIANAPTYIAIDATWNDSFYEDLAYVIENNPEYKAVITPIRITQPIKMDMIRRAQVLISNKSLLVPKTAESREDKLALQSWWEEHEIYQYDLSPTGAFRYSAPEGKHDDAVMASCLALYLAYPDVGVRKKNLEDFISNNQKQTFIRPPLSYVRELYEASPAAFSNSALSHDAMSYDALSFDPMFIQDLTDFTGTEEAGFSHGGYFYSD
ncbi:MAG: hypothetical protein KatS3mg087_1295 [Patescibacteria group bacterium]|nr:MAG: hypothetical protein KatS3mg087_1295 [Patescibacteria group bacterium]